MDEDQVESTLYSLTDEPPAEPLNERPERFLSLLRVGTLVIGERRELCMIRNISAAGMMIRVYSTVPIGTKAAVELKQGEPVEGTVAWAKDGALGLAFAEPIDVIDLISPPGDGPPPRMPRIELDAIAWVREGASVRRTRLFNVSQGGICVSSPVALTPEAEVIVTLNGLPPAPASVRWRDGDRYGITFHRVLPLPGLVSWLEEQRSQRPPAKVAV